MTDLPGSSPETGSLVPLGSADPLIPSTLPPKHISATELIRQGFTHPGPSVGPLKGSTRKQQKMEIVVIFLSFVLKFSGLNN